MNEKTDLNQIFEQLIKEFLKIGIPIQEQHICREVRMNRRVTALGTCEKNHITGVYTISLSDHALKSKKEIINTLAHELLHTIPGCMNHGTRFQRFANVLKTYGFNISTKASKHSSAESGIQEAYVKNARYRVTCETCKKTFYRQKKSKLIQHPEYYRCTCGGKLYVERLNQVQAANKVQILDNMGTLWTTDGSGE